jgi:dihydrofolate reductase
MISLIACIGKNRELGKDNALIWHIPQDLQRFKHITLGHPIIMGRKTFASIGRPLEGRTNIVVTSDKTFSAVNAIVTSSLEEAIETAKTSPGADELFIIGGGTIYAQAINFADRLYLTIVNETAPADTFFPDYSEFKTIISSETHQYGSLTFSYTTFEK